jgi:hypothetical protein
MKYFKNYILIMTDYRLYWSHSKALLFKFGTNFSCSFCYFYPPLSRMYDGIIEMSMRIAERMKILCNDFRKLSIIAV